MGSNSAPAGRSYMALGGEWRGFQQGHLRLMWPHASTSLAALQGLGQLKEIVAAVAARQEQTLIAARASSFKRRLAEKFPG